MGGDMFVPTIAGDHVEKAHGDDLRQAWAEEFEPMLPEVRPSKASETCSPRSASGA